MALNDLPYQQGTKDEIMSNVKNILPPMNMN